MYIHTRNPPKPVEPHLFNSTTNQGSRQCSLGPELSYSVPGIVSGLGDHTSIKNSQSFMSLRTSIAVQQHKLWETMQANGHRSDILLLCSDDTTRRRHDQVCAATWHTIYGPLLYVCPRRQVVQHELFCGVFTCRSILV